MGCREKIPLDRCLVFELGPVRAPRTAETDDKVHLAGTKVPFRGVLPGQFDERVPAPAQCMTDETGIGVVPISDQGRAHDHYGRCPMGASHASGDPISPESVRAARAAGTGVVKHTPVTESAALSDMCGGTVVLKAENLQRTGSFKIRGAMNKIATLGDAATSGVVAGSAGNHAQAIAFAARKRGIPCEIFVPSGASLSKMESVRSYGATLSEGGDTLDAAV